MKTTIKLSKLAPVLPAEVVERLSAYNPEEVEVRRKQYTGSEITIAEGERASVGLITTKAVDRDGDILLPQGAMLDAYTANPVVLWAHNSSMPPIGKAVEMEVTDYGIRAKTIYAETERAQEVWQLVKGGFLNAHSIGFIPVEWVDKGTKGWDAAAKTLTPQEIDGATRIYTKYELLEYSVVPVPANQTALMEAVGKGLELSADLAKSLGIEANGTPAEDEGPEPDIELQAELPEDKKSQAVTLPQITLNQMVSLPPVELTKEIPLPEIKITGTLVPRKADDTDAILKEAIARIKGDFAD